MASSSSRVPVDAAFFIRAARLLRDELPLLCDARVRGVADVADVAAAEAAEAAAGGGGRLLLTASALDSMLGALAEYVCLPAYALTVARYFKPALLEIFARATSSSSTRGGPSLEERALAFGRVVTVSYSPPARRRCRHAGWCLIPARRPLPLPARPQVCPP